MRIYKLVFSLLAGSLLLGWCSSVGAYVPNTWTIEVFKNDNGTPPNLADDFWDYIVDPPGLLEFQGDLEFDNQRLGFIANPTGLQTFNILSVGETELGPGLKTSILRDIRGAIPNPADLATAVSGDVFSIRFQALDESPIPPTVSFFGGTNGSIGSFTNFAVSATDSGSFNSWIATVPEPSSIALLVIGLAGLAGVTRPGSCFRQRGLRKSDMK